MLGNTKRCLERKRNERRQSSREGPSSVHKRSPLEPRNYQQRTGHGRPHIRVDFKG